MSLVAGKSRFDQDDLRLGMRASAAELAHMFSNRSQHVVVQVAVRDDDSAVGREFPAVSELQRLAVDVGDFAARLFDDQHSARVSQIFSR